VPTERARRAIRVTAPSWCEADCRLYGAFFVWAPGPDIAFVLVQGDLYPERLYAIDRDGSGQRLLSGPLQDIYWPAWSPLADRIAFVFRSGSVDQVWTANAEGSGLRQVTRIRSRTSNLSGIYDPVWSSDGKSIAGFGWAGGFFVADATTGKAHQVVRRALDPEESQPNVA
jgi:Tol biopolymer transport system component